MKSNDLAFGSFVGDYLEKLSRSFDERVVDSIEKLTCDLVKASSEGNAVYICGNGGSAANAVHIANDWLTGGSHSQGKVRNGMNVEALTANSAILTCLANDIGYDAIFSSQLAVKAREGDILVVLSGSGNSPNIIQALEEAKGIGMKSYAIVGFTGGAAVKLADVGIHFKVSDMQASEDLQLIVGHICMQWMRRRRGR